MRCQGVIGPYGFRCFFYEDKANWRSCCDIADANLHLAAYIYHVGQKNLLAGAEWVAQRPGRTHGRLRWLRPCNDVPGARRRHGRPRRRI